MPCWIYDGLWQEVWKRGTYEEEALGGLFLSADSMNDFALFKLCELSGSFTFFITVYFLLSIWKLIEKLLNDHF